MTPESYARVLAEIETCPGNPNAVTCGECGFTWDDSKSTDLTPAPSARCPNEYNHDSDDDNKVGEVELLAPDPDVSEPGTLGLISGIMAGIRANATIALISTTDIAGQSAGYYRKVLGDILKDAERAEQAYYRYEQANLGEDLT